MTMEAGQARAEVEAHGPHFELRASVEVLVALALLLHGR